MKYVRTRVLLKTRGSFCLDCGMTLVEHERFICLWGSVQNPPLKGQISVLSASTGISEFCACLLLVMLRHYNVNNVRKMPTDPISCIMREKWKWGKLRSYVPVVMPPDLAFGYYCHMAHFYSRKYTFSEHWNFCWSQNDIISCFPA